MGLFSRLLGPRVPSTSPAASPPPTPVASPPPTPAPAPPTRAPAPALRRTGELPAWTGPGLVAFFTEDHRACDEGWGAVEAAAEGAPTVEAWRRFDAALRRHLGWEEEQLFPKLDDLTGHHGFGPTEIMRGEHAQMRALLDEMGRCAETGDRAGLLEQGDTLMMLIQQHNAKEEGMLYPMAEELFGERGWQALAPQLR